MLRNRLKRSVLQNKISRNLYIVGKNSIFEIFDTNYENFEAVVVSENYNSPKIKAIVEKAKKHKIPIYHDSKLIEVIDKELLVDTSGIVVFLKRHIDKTLSLRNIKDYISQLEYCTVVALPNVEYEHNLGAMIRTCTGLNVDFLLIPNGQQKVFESTVTKVSMGYNFVLPIVKENFLLAIDELKKLGFQVMGLDVEGENIVKFRYNPKVCFVMGNEGKGLTDTVTKKCDKMLSIPMNSSVESLNVSISLGITLYDRLSKLS